MPDISTGRTRLAYLVMVFAPLFFSTNLVFGRGVVDAVSPFTLALLRWLAVAIALMPFMLREAATIRAVLGAHWRLVAILALLGMWICGGGVYLALQMTTATNATLIYTTSPVIILLLEAVFRGRRIGVREVAGGVLAFAGVATIVLRGDPLALFSLDFNAGDIIILIAAIAWAAYSILYRSPHLQRLSTFALLGLMASAGALMLLPAAAIEWMGGARLPMSAEAWSGVAGIVIFSSLLAFSTFQFGLRQLGAPVAGVFMYLLPPYGVLMAVLLLGETFEPFHAAGIAFVMGGVILATFPAKR